MGNPTTSRTASTSEVEDIVHQIAGRFRTFGGGRDSETNPLAHALKDGPLLFAAGVNVEEVVDFVLSFRRGARDQPASVDAVREDAR